MLGCFLSLLVRLHIVLDLPIDSPGINHPIRAINFVRLSAPPSLSSQPASLPFVVWQSAALALPNCQHRVQRTLCLHRKKCLWDLRLCLVDLVLGPLDQLGNVGRHYLLHVVLREVFGVDGSTCAQRLVLCLEPRHKCLCVLPCPHLCFEVLSNIPSVLLCIVTVQKIHRVLEGQLVAVPTLNHHRHFKLLLCHVK